MRTPKTDKPIVLEEFGVTGLENKTSVYAAWVQKALETGHAGIMPWQYGQLGLTEDGGNKIFKYADALINGVRSRLFLTLKYRKCIANVRFATDCA